MTELGCPICDSSERISYLLVSLLNLIEIVEPPVKSIPGFKPGEIIKNITPILISMSEREKNQIRLFTKSTIFSCYSLLFF